MTVKNIKIKKDGNYMYCSICNQYIIEETKEYQEYSKIDYKTLKVVKDPVCNKCYEKIKFKI